MREARDERSFSKAQKASPLLFSFALCPGCHSRRFVKQHTLPPVSHFLLWAANPNWCSCLTPHACLFPSRPSLPPFFFLSLNTCVQTADQPERRIPRQPFNIERCETWWKEKENKWDVIFNVKHQMWAFIISHPPPLSCLAAVTLAVLLGATPCQVEFRDSDTVSSNPSSGLSVSPGEKKRRGRRTETQRKTSWKTRGDRSWKSGSQIERRFCFLQYSYESLVRVQGLTVQNRAFKS